MNAAAKNYLKKTTATATEKNSRCTVTQDGELLFSIKFNRIPTEKELHDGVDEMLKDYPCIPKYFREAIIRQVETCVTFSMRIAS